MSRVKWPSGDETELVIVTLEVAIPGHQPMSGQLAVQRKDFGRKVAFEQLVEDAQRLAESVIMEVNFSMDPHVRVNSPKTNDKE